ncbi:hypothetical protein E3N88_33555 [Mikania micrantha]|uniref:Zinc finger GRF-type domain-containing protein n=1 Tax=Mikania micrantha TaxID=192012 RepID=A0A5N6MBS2_9ASTR|nr:hypothetical protein E3N88_33555 [Mikania micrantha]
MKSDEDNQLVPPPYPSRTVTRSQKGLRVPRRFPEESKIFSSIAYRGGLSSPPPLRNNQIRIFKVGVDDNVYYKYDMVAIMRVAGSRSTRQGHEFYGCPLWPRLDCKFFIWKEEVDAMFSDGCNHKLLESKNKALEMKIANLKVKKTMLEE